jgi:cytochrome oxidase assembly protein ShyY1
MQSKKPARNQVAREYWIEEMFANIQFRISSPARDLSKTLKIKAQKAI